MDSHEAKPEKLSIPMVMGHSFEDPVTLSIIVRKASATGIPKPPCVTS